MLRVPCWLAGRWLVAEALLLRVPPDPLLVLVAGPYFLVYLH